ncbi:MAG: NDMA-dependent alcohol dehydrogenase [Sporichthyaceae bacterium]
MQVEAAVLWDTKQPWSIESVELDPPKAGEVLVRVIASGLCHTDDHAQQGDTPAPLPLIGGHEGAGIVEEVGPGVTGVKVGDHCVLAFIPSCGRCTWCITGHSNLCDLGAHLVTGPQLDGTYRFHGRGQDLAQMFLISTFSPYTVVPADSVVVIDDDLPLDKVGLIGCGVTTGWGSAVYAAEVRPGDTVAVMGVGGVGAAAVQGARIAGAENIVAIDPVAMKRENAESMGATHSAPDAESARALIEELTRGSMAAKAIITVDLNQPSYIKDALSLVGKRGRVVLTAVTRADTMHADMGLYEMTVYEKQLVGCLFGSANPRRDIPMLCSLYRSGQLMLDELVTRTYPLRDLNQGYLDMKEGRNVRGMVLHQH